MRHIIKTNIHQINTMFITIFLGFDYFIFKLIQPITEYLNFRILSPNHSAFHTVYKVCLILDFVFDYYVHAICDLLISKLLTFSVSNLHQLGSICIKTLILLAIIGAIWPIRSFFVLYICVRFIEILIFNFVFSFMQVQHYPMQCYYLY